MTTGKWIDGDGLGVGDVGFLVQRVNEFKQSDQWLLTDHPPYTNQSFMPKLTGWCGGYNDTHIYGRGMARVAKLARNGRAYVVALEGAALQAALEELGYPELTPKETV